MSSWNLPSHHGIFHFTIEIFHLICEDAPWTNHIVEASSTSSLKRCLKDVVEIYLCASIKPATFLIQALMHKPQNAQATIFET